MPSPDILWIVTTQWRAQAFGAAGDPNARTPCLDALRSRSLDFTHAVTPHPFGPFARAALLTGISSPQNGVRDYFDPLPADSRTVAHQLRELGYSTAFLGKWHLAPRDPRAELVGPAHARTIVPPAYRGGFDFWEGFEGGFLLNDPWLHGTRLPQPVQFSGYQADVLCERAVDLLRNADRGMRIGSGSGKLHSSANPQPAIRHPQFLLLSLETPHPPYDAPVPAGIERRDPREIVLRPNVTRGGRIEQRARRELAGYYAHIEATDRAIGRLLETMTSSARQRGRPCLVVFTSVHGDMHGAHGLFRKGWPHEESVGVPLFVSNLGPGGKLRGASRSVISLLDLPALSVEAVSTGAAAFAEFGAGVARISMPSVVHLPDQCDRAWTGVRTSNRKLILSGDRPWLFFDLDRDPMEFNNLVEHSGRRDEIESLMRCLR